MRSSRVSNASIMCCGRFFSAIISRRSSLANSVISSPFMSKSLVGREVSKSVKFSVFIVFLVAASPAPRREPKTSAKKSNAPLIMSGIVPHFFITTYNR